VRHRQALQKVLRHANPSVVLPDDGCLAEALI
jgi:hypothetical protein